MKIIILLGLIVSVFSECIIDNGIRIQPKSYKDPFKYVICNEKCGDLCGSEGCSSLTNIFDTKDQSSLNCCGSYIKRTCIVNDQILTGCYDDGIHKLPVVYCDETNGNGPCILRQNDYQTCGFEEEDNRKFGIDEKHTLTTSEIVWIGVGCFLFAIIVFFSITFLCYKYKTPKTEEEEEQHNENDIEVR